MKIYILWKIQAAWGQPRPSHCLTPLILTQSQQSQISHLLLHSYCFAAVLILPTAAPCHLYPVTPVTWLKGSLNKHLNILLTALKSNIHFVMKNFMMWLVCLDYTDICLQWKGKEVLRRESLPSVPYMSFFKIFLANGCDCHDWLKWERVQWAGLTYLFKCCTYWLPSKQRVFFQI